MKLYTELYSVRVENTLNFCIDLWRLTSTCIVPAGWSQFFVALNYADMTAAQIWIVFYKLCKTAHNKPHYKINFNTWDLKRCKVQEITS